ncbi:MAG: hypothetical protein ACYT04_22985 [Nostoc sp.]
MGWATRGPVAQGGQDAHPTSSSNLFVGSPLEQGDGRVNRDVYDGLFGDATLVTLKLKCFGSKAMKECVLQLDNHAAIVSCFV